MPYIHSYNIILWILLIINYLFLLVLKHRQLWPLVWSLVQHVCIWGEYSSLKPGWTPIRELSTPDDAAHISAAANHHATPSFLLIIDNIISVWMVATVIGITSWIIPVASTDCILWFYYDTVYSKNNNIWNVGTTKMYFFRNSAQSDRDTETDWQGNPRHIGFPIAYTHSITGHPHKFLLNDIWIHWNESAYYVLSHTSH